MQATQTESENIEPEWVRDVLRFWFEELSVADWFKKDDNLDTRIRDRFMPLRERLMAQRGDGAVTPRAMLAVVIVLDQFSRNAFRGDARAYAADPIARAVARSAIEQGFDVALSAEERMFLYLPFEHSENAADQLFSVNLFKSLGNQEWTRYAIGHKAQIDRFGRFPHRNAILGRRSTPEEIAFLEGAAS